MSAEEFVVVDADGNASDEELHNEILMQPDAEEFIMTSAVKRAIEKGMSEDLARKLYGDYASSN